MASGQFRVILRVTGIWGVFLCSVTVPARRGLPSRCFMLPVPFGGMWCLVFSDNAVGVSVGSSVCPVVGAWPSSAVCLSVCGHSHPAGLWGCLVCVEGKSRDYTWLENSGLVLCSFLI